MNDVIDFSMPFSITADVRLLDTESLYAPNDVGGFRVSAFAGSYGLAIMNLDAGSISTAHQTRELDFDPAAAFHTYRIEATPGTPYSLS